MDTLISILETPTIPDILFLIFIVIIFRTILTVHLIMKDRDF